MSRLKRLRTWQKWTIGIVALVFVIGAVSGDGDDKPDEPRTKRAEKARPAKLDDTTLFNSVAHVFIARYSRVVAATSRLSPESRAFCTDEHPPMHTCELRIDVPIVSDISWLYDVTLTGSCWIARTRDRYGALQGSIDAYRNRDTFAPSTAQVRSDIRQADQLRVLRGCASNVPRPIAAASPERFVAALAAQNVQRERPGRQTAAECEYEGKHVIALAPDSWNFTCTVSLGTGKSYVDKLVCFDPPPYESLDACGEERGYPKRPPRPLPE